MRSYTDDSETECLYKLSLGRSCSNYLLTSDQRHVSLTSDASLKKETSFVKMMKRKVNFRFSLRESKKCKNEKVECFNFDFLTLQGNVFLQSDDLQP